MPYFLCQYVGFSSCKAHRPLRRSGFLRPRSCSLAPCQVLAILAQSVRPLLLSTSAWLILMPATRGTMFVGLVSCLSGSPLITEIVANMMHGLVAQLSQPGEAKSHSLLNPAYSSLRFAQSPLPLSSNVLSKLSWGRANSPGVSSLPNMAPRHDTEAANSKASKASFV
jgi:hypothetical protein